jgi:hypothetical protein
VTRGTGTTTSVRVCVHAHACRWCVVCTNSNLHVVAEAAAAAALVAVVAVVLTTVTIARAGPFCVFVPVWLCASCCLKAALMQYLQESYNSYYTKKRAVFKSTTFTERGKQQFCVHTNTHLNHWSCFEHDASTSHTD